MFCYLLLCISLQIIEMEFENPEKLTSSLGKLLRYFCDGHVQFDSWIQVSGQLCLITEGGKSVGFSISEKVCKISETSTNITTNSYPIEFTGENVQNFHKWKVEFQDNGDSIQYIHGVIEDEFTEAKNDNTNGALNADTSIDETYLRTVKEQVEMSNHIALSKEEENIDLPIEQQKSSSLLKGKSSNDKLISETI